MGREHFNAPDIAGDDEGCPDLEPPEGLSADTADSGIGEDAARTRRGESDGRGKEGNERVRQGQYGRRRPRHRENGNIETLLHFRGLSCITLDACGEPSPQKDLGTVAGITDQKAKSFEITSC